MVDEENKKIQEEKNLEQEKVKREQDEYDYQHGYGKYDMPGNPRHYPGDPNVRFH